MQLAVLFSMRQTCQPLYDHATPRCEAAPWHLVLHTRKGNVARATSFRSCVGAAAAALISTAVAASRNEAAGA